jgi:hypothetical protein
MHIFDSRKETKPRVYVYIYILRRYRKKCLRNLSLVSIHIEIAASEYLMFKWMNILEVKTYIFLEILYNHTMNK